MLFFDRITGFHAMDVVWEWRVDALIERTIQVGLCGGGCGGGDFETRCFI